MTHQFFSALFADAPPNTYLLVWTLPDRRSRFFRADRLDDAEACARDLACTRDVYVACGLRGRDHGQHARGGAEDVVAIPGVWADIDFMKPGSARRYFANGPTALGYLATLRFRPTIIVLSGHGLHVYWLFPAVWCFADGAERAQGAALVERWQTYLRMRAVEAGAEIDSTHDLARVLRVAGTMHHKWRLPVVIESADGPRVDPAALGDFLGDVVISETPIITTVPTDIAAVHGPACPAVVVEALQLHRRACPPADKFAALFTNSGKFRDSWRRQRPDLADQSASAFDQSLATLAVQAGWTDQEVVDLLLAHRQQHGAVRKRPDYYRRTIATARAGLARQVAADTAFEQAVLTGRGAA